MTWVSDHKSDPNILKWRLLHLDWNDDDGNDEFFYTDCDVPIAYDGEYWEPRSFSIGSVTLSPFGASCSVVIPDSDQELFAQLALTNGAQGRTVIIYEGYFATDNLTNTPTQVVKIFQGRVTSTRKETAGGRDDVELQCGPPVEPNSIQIPPRLLSSLVSTA